MIDPLRVRAVMAFPPDQVPDRAVRRSLQRKWLAAVATLGVKWGNHPANHIPRVKPAARDYK